MKILLFLILFLNVTIANCSLRCEKTNAKGPQVNKPCIFPFTIGNVTYNECTKNHDPFSKPWCSTQVTTDGKHVTDVDQWGYCDPGTIFYQFFAL